MPGFGPVLAAEFLGATGGDLTVFEFADRFARLAPAPRDSGRITGNHHRPRRYDRRLLRVFCLSGLSALKSCPVSRRYYDRKRVEGKTHIQAMLSLARRRLNVLWAMLRTAPLTLPFRQRHHRWQPEELKPEPGFGREHGQSPGLRCRRAGMRSGGDPGFVRSRAADAVAPEPECFSGPDRSPSSGFG